MILIRPKLIADGTDPAQTNVMLDTNLVEVPPPEWVAGTPYIVGQQVSVYAGTVATVYTSLQSGNLNHSPASNPTWWQLAGTTFAPYSATRMYATGERIADTVAHRVYESLSGGTSSEVLISIASPAVVTWIAHGLPVGTQIVFTTDDTLPTGINAGQIYYVSTTTADTFQLAEISGGAAINSSGDQAGTHTATARPNLNKPVTDPSFWLDAGPTNKWAMFDSYNGTVTTHHSVIDVTIDCSGRVDSLALLNIANAVSARIVVTTGDTAGSVGPMLLLGGGDGAQAAYDETFSLNATEAVTNWYQYFFEEIDRRDTLLVTGLPVNANPTVQVIITGNGDADVQCGVMVVGLSKDLGRTLHDGAQIGIIDYSRKDVDEFGNYTIVRRAFSRRGSFRMRLPKTAVDGVHKKLAEFRATPAVYSATRDYRATMIFGFFRDFNVEIDYPNESLVSIEIEGLT